MDKRGHSDEDQKAVPPWSSPKRLRITFDRARLPEIREAWRRRLAEADRSLWNPFFAKRTAEIEQRRAADTKEIRRLQEITWKQGLASQKNLRRGNQKDVHVSPAELDTALEKVRDRDGIKFKPACQAVANAYNNQLKERLERELGKRERLSYKYVERHSTVRW